MSLRIKATLDGKPVTLICSYEFLQDLEFRKSMYSCVRTPDPTKEEIADWQHYDKMLGNPKFWEGARSRVKVENTNFPKPYQDSKWNMWIGEDPFNFVE